MHALVSAQVRELGVGLEADIVLSINRIYYYYLEAHLAPEGLHAAVDVGVLLEAGGGREGLETHRI